MTQADELNAGAISSPHPDVKSQLAADIQSFVSRYNKASYGVRLLATKVGLTEKTVKRLMSAENNPSYSTLFQFYCYFTSSKTHNELIERAPEVIRKALIKKKPTKINETSVSNDFDFYAAIKKQPLLGEIYLVAVTEGIDRNKVVHRYGQYGMEIVHTLIEHDLLRSLDKNTFTVSPNGPQFDHRVIYALGKHFSERFFKMDDAPIGRNTIGFYADCLNEKGYKKWLAIEQECYYKKLEVAKDESNQGAIPVFTFGVTDTMIPEREEQ
ncbi:MAG: hypothetical protein HRT45_04010 [Bdellovibrionales bacterium]|nr:hypothetical protein [Bdellovibrionales bacterium]